MIRATEERLQTAVKDTGAGYFFIDPQGCFQWVNDAWLSLHKYSSLDEVAGRHFSITQAPGALATAERIVQDLLGGKVIPAMEFNRKCKDGTVGSHMFSAHRVMDGDQVAGIEGFLIDTTGAHEAEERYQMLFTQMMDGFALHEMIFDAEGRPADYRFLAVNPAFEKMTGLPAENILGRTVLEVLPGTEAFWIQNYGKVVLTGEPLRFESSHSGLNKHFDVYAFRPRKGQFACIFRDISELKARVAEIGTLAEKMRQAADDYRGIFEGALEGIYRTSPEGHILAANPAMARMLGFDEADLIQPIAISADQVWADPEDRLPFLRLVEEQGSVSANECRFRRKDGTIIWVSASCRKVAGADGKTAFYEGFVEDITERKQAEEKLRISENKFRMAFMTGTDAFVIATLKEGLILDVNDRFTEVFGYSAEEARGQPSTALGLYASFDRHRLVSEVTAKGWVRDMEFQARRKDGGLISVMVSANLLQDAGESLLLTVVRDVTEQKRAQEEKIELEHRFRQAQKLESVGLLAGGIAHDFNNLLTVINGYSDMLLRECKPGDPIREWIEEIRQAGDRAANLTRQLLAFSRKQITEPRPICLHGLVADMQSMLRRIMGEDIELVIPDDPSAGTVMADPGQLHQVLMNLAVNARDAMPEGGVLTIRTANVEAGETAPAGHPEIATGPYVTLVMSDTGVGIAHEIQERIFDPFFTTKTEGEGTGLGLSTVYGIVRQLGGSIGVSSEPGHGATFEIYLPRVEQAIGVDSPAERLTPERGSETVLVVEDWEPIRNLAVNVLKRNGYVVLHAANGGDALLAAERHAGPIHLLVTDVVMPRMTGKELAERLRPLRPEMKVLYMSGYAVDTITRRGLLELDAPYLAKPFVPEELAVKVREVLGSFRAKGTILVVDDEASVRAFFQQVLAGAGYEVVIARDGAEAVKKMREWRFDLLLTDLVMPEREGLDIIRAMHKEWPDLKIVAVSGAFGGAFLSAAQLLGANRTLLKPISPDQLLAAVREALS